MEEELYSAAAVRVFTTARVDLEEGRTFVWAKTKWYERVTASNGAVEFVHVADSEPDLHRWLAEEEQIDPTALNEVDRGQRFYRDIVEEFSGEAPLYPEAPESSDEAPFSEEQTDVDEARGYHVEG